MSGNYAIKIIVGVCVIVASILLYNFSIPRSVDSFGPLKLGDQTPMKVGNGIVIAPYNTVWESRFYVYAVQKDMGYCAFEDCGMSGTLIDCMEGWLSADAEMAADEYGLKQEDVEAGKSSMIIVADKDQKIVGIYPNSVIQNIPYILKNHRNLSNRFDFCYNLEMPRR